MKVRLVEGIWIIALSDQQPLIFMKLDLLQADDLIRTLFQLSCQRQQTAPGVWQPEPKTV